MNSTSQITKTDIGKLLHGDCRSLLRTLKPDSVDMICTDPPYGIGFMGKTWDSFSGGQAAFQAFMHEASKECLRVLKPGGFMFVVMTPRQDCLARVLVAMEDAGFAMGFTSLYWAYASGFPKASHIGRAADKRAGKRRRILGSRKLPDLRGNNYGRRRGEFTAPITGGPVSAAAKRLEGAYGGFQPKPAVEVIVVAMKPLSEKGYLDQALTNGKGITWLGDVRIPGEPVMIRRINRGQGCGPRTTSHRQTHGRFPANLMVSNKVLGDFSRYFCLDSWARERLPFLTVPKASRREKQLSSADRPKDNFDFYDSRRNKKRGNTHPTVKPLALMAHLIALGSRPGDVVLDPFLGSGTTAVAAKLLGRRYIGVERERKYLAIARSRLAMR